jgi:hypothetical protein
MAKQTFSVGQVLTAAQMTSLQQTAMGGGAASSKTANYVLVAADAGTAISMTSTSATTITVNTGLFSAGDTVFIQNLGSATCTITAGTATVNTAGSLILPQYDAGILYFVSASSAIFYDYIQVGATSPLTTKGDLYTFSTSDTRLGVGANGTTLVADSAEATGLKWATASSGAYTLLSTTAISGSTVSVTGISSSYTELIIVVTDYRATNDNSDPTFRFNNDSGSNYVYSGTNFGSVTSSGTVSGVTSIPFGGGSGLDNTATDGFAVLRLFRYAATDTFKAGHSYFCYPQNDGFFSATNMAFAYKSTSAITRFDLSCNAAGWASAGNILIYGAN